MIKKYRAEALVMGKVEKVFNVDDEEYNEGDVEEMFREDIIKGKARVEFDEIVHIDAKEIHKENLTVQKGGE